MFRDKQKEQWLMFSNNPDRNIKLSELKSHYGTIEVETVFFSATQGRNKKMRSYFS